MRPDLDDPPGIEDDQAVGAAERRQAVGDGDRGPAGDEPIDRRLDRHLRLRIDRRGRLVEDQDRRIDQEGPGDRNPLAFTAGE